MCKYDIDLVFEQIASRTAFYNKSSSKTKVPMYPVLLQMQKMMFLYIGRLNCWKTTLEGNVVLTVNIVNVINYCHNSTSRHLFSQKVQVWKYTHIKHIYYRIVKYLEQL